MILPGWCPMNADDHLAAFCRTLPQLRAAARHQGLAAELAAVLTEVRAGVPVAELLPRLGIPADALRSSPDVRPGSPGGRPGSPGGGYGYQTLPSLDGRPTGGAHTCPWDACGRTVRREP